MSSTTHCSTTKVLDISDVFSYDIPCGQDFLSEIVIVKNCFKQDFLSDLDIVKNQFRKDFLSELVIVEKNLFRQNFLSELVQIGYSI